jgi:hypothetical protein
MVRFFYGKLANGDPLLDQRGGKTDTVLAGQPPQATDFPAGQGSGLQLELLQQGHPFLCCLEQFQCGMEGSATALGSPSSAMGNGTGNPFLGYGKGLLETAQDGLGTIGAPLGIGFESC